MLLSSVHSSSPFSACTTPVHSSSSYYTARSHKPVNSSPLASPRHSSPTHDVQERRRAQYKPTASHHHHHHHHFHHHRSAVTPSSAAATPAAKFLFRAADHTPEDPQKTFFRERLQAQCRQHAQKMRERTVRARRSSDKYTDVFMDCDEEEETDEVVMQDELFRRIMHSARQKKNYAYRVSYALEVGSSFDPDMEDASAWESELRGQASSGAEPTPEDLAEEELAEYAALADFADLDQLSVDDVGTLSDFDETPPDVLDPDGMDVM